MRVRLTQLDGSLPNLALAKLSAWHKAQGDEVTVTRSVERTLFDQGFDRVYGSTIFRFGDALLRRFQANWPEAIVGGTGTDNTVTVEAVTGPDWDRIDLSGWPEFTDSIGFTQRGCRLKCGFCVVPKKEGANRSVGTIAQIWRGDPHPKQIHLLDNDFFGQPGWRDRIAEIREGGFKVCISQGINTRLIDDEAAAALATIEYRDDSFTRRRLYTAWDSIGDEAIFFRGVDRLEAAGIPPRHLMAYTLVGYDKAEDWDRIWYRYGRMVARGIMPYPMVFDRSREDLRAWARWAIRYSFVPWDEFDDKRKAPESVEAWQRHGALLAASA